TGSGFTAAQKILFGTVAVSSFTINSDTSISVTAPPQGAGTVDVSVVSPYGTSIANPGGRFTYLAAAPTVTALGTTTGPTSGGTSVTVTGSNLTGATRVLFGTVVA